MKDTKISQPFKREGAMAFEVKVSLKTTEDPQNDDLVSEFVRLQVELISPEVQIVKVADCLMVRTHTEDEAQAVVKHLDDVFADIPEQTRPTRSEIWWRPPEVVE